MITRMDRDIGRLVDHLHARGLDRNTLILFVSDNGPHQEGGGDPVFFKSSGGLRGIKRDLYEGGIRVPMIARWVGTIPAGRVSNHPWAHWDMLPTLAELAGARAPDGLDGLSMTRALRGERAADARLLLLGVPRARLSAGRADGEVEGRAARRRHAARAVRPRRGSAGGAQRRGGESGRRRASRVVSADGAKPFGALAGCTGGCAMSIVESRWFARPETRTRPPRRPAVAMAPAATADRCGARRRPRTARASIHVRNSRRRGRARQAVLGDRIADVFDGNRVTAALRATGLSAWFISAVDERRLLGLRDARSSSPQTSGWRTCDPGCAESGNVLSGKRTMRAVRRERVRWWHRDHAEIRSRPASCARRLVAKPSRRQWPSSHPRRAAGTECGSRALPEAGSCHGAHLARASAPRGAMRARASAERTS